MSLQSDSNLGGHSNGDSQNAGLHCACDHHSAAASHAVAFREQTAKTPGVSRFVGIWAGDAKANEAALQTGLFPAEQTMTLSIERDRLKLVWSRGRFAETLFYVREK